MNLPDRVREVYANREQPELLQLVHPSTVEALELSISEVKALCGMLLVASEDNTGLLAQAQEMAEMKDAAFVPAAKSLKVAGLVELDIINRTFDLTPATKMLRVESEYELGKQVERGVRDPWAEDEEPPRSLVLRSLKDTVISLARSGSGARGLARVYSHVFGRSVNGREWGMLGIIHKALGTDRAAVLMLENATQPWDYPLGELVRYARAQERGFRTEEQEADRKAYSSLERQALKRRMERWWRYGANPDQVAAFFRTTLAEGASPDQVEQNIKDARRDFRAWEEVS